MYQKKGYIEQQIEALAAVLARILTGKDARQYEAALAEIGSACQNHCGLSVSLLIALPEKTLLSMFQAGGRFDAGRGVVAAVLLDEHAQVMELQSRLGAARASRCQSLTLLTEALIHEARLRTAEYQGRVNAIAHRIEEDGMPDGLAERMRRYHETVE